jgi:hypothetical protein
MPTRSAYFLDQGPEHLPRHGAAARGDEDGVRHVLLEQFAARAGVT